MFKDYKTLDVLIDKLSEGKLKKKNTKIAKKFISNIYGKNSKNEFLDILKSNL